MKITKLKNHYNIIIITLCVICAVIARILGNSGFYSIFFGLIRTMIYIGLYIGWGISVNNRVMQTQVRQYLLYISGLIVFWFILRSIKYYFVSNPDFSRYLWYLYYLPMLLIPLLSVFISMSLGKAENYHLPKWTVILYIPTLFCLFLVLTNDFHQLVFSFPKDEIWTDKNNGYLFGYYIVIGWEIICALTAFIIMLYKCRLSQRKKYLPFILLSCSIIYAFIYLSDVKWLRVIGGDITAVQCLFFAGILESCIQCGLIQTNSGYKDLFEIGTINAQITDMDFHTRYASSNAPKLTKELAKATKNNVVNLDRNTLLKANKIDGGYILWQEDITNINTLTEQLEENKKNISESNNLEQENYKTKVKINTIQEKNRLYNILQTQTSHQIEILDSLLTQYDNETDPKIRKNLLAKAAVIGSYIKRKGNLIFIAEKCKIIDTAEISVCLDESLANLKLLGVECAIDIPSNNKIYVDDAICIYDFFEAVTEAAINDISSVWLKGRILSDKIIFCLEIETGEDLSKLSKDYTFEENVWRFTMNIKRVSEQ